MASGVPMKEMVPIRSKVPRNSARIGVIFFLLTLKNENNVQ
jgi:hypothetical protein